MSGLAYMLFMLNRGFTWYMIIWTIIMILYTFVILATDGQQISLEESMLYGELRDSFGQPRVKKYRKKTIKYNKSRQI